MLSLYVLGIEEDRIVEEEDGKGKEESGVLVDRRRIIQFCNFQRMLGYYFECFIYVFVIGEFQRVFFNFVFLFIFCFIFQIKNILFFKEIQNIGIDLV